LITITHSWRYIYYVATALIGGLTILVILTLPETSYVRSTSGTSNSIAAVTSEKDLEEVHVTSDKADQTDCEVVEHSSKSSSAQGVAQSTKQPFVRSLRLFNGRFSEESLWKIAYRPVILLVLPPVLWATLVMSVTIGFLVAISSNFASAFASTYNFTSWQSGLCFVSGMVGTLIGILGGGWFSDWVADFFTQRNGGIREPEMRLPAITVALICSPLALALYGSGIEYKWHWMVPTFGLGLC
jgi:Major Facilitator Superfamily